ncbi:hypothetical protein SUGI_0698520 [Cryptomeria japonica]|nr:hypothetical protein SUGI_0698520 [Cryptomeria japonica]
MSLDHSADQNQQQSSNHPKSENATHGPTIYHSAMGDYFLGYSERKEGSRRSVEHLNEKGQGEHSDHKTKKTYIPVGIPAKPKGETRPYVLEPTPTDPKTNSAMKGMVVKCSKRVKDLVEHLKLGPSMFDTVKGKLTLGVDIVKKGGKENLFKERFVCDGQEKLLKACACHLSTSTGPIGGLLFISNKQLAFCSDRSLTFTNPSGGIAQSYYRVSISTKKIVLVSSCENPDKPSEKYIQIQTMDNYEFWFMGFVNFHKAYKYI